MRKTSNFSITSLPNSKCLLAIFTLKLHHQRVKGMHWFLGSRMSYGCTRVYHSLLQKNKATINWLSREKTGGKCALTFLFPSTKHTNGNSAHFQSELLLSYAPILFWQPLSSKSNRQNTLILFLTLPFPISTSSQV